MENSTNETYLILGTNLGNRAAQLEAAKKQIIQSMGCIVKESSIYETEPWGITDQPSFYNQVVLVQTPLDASSLLQRIATVEAAMGRVRVEKYGARVIDIDILFFNNEIDLSPELTLPHPRIAERNFVLAPLSEIAGALIHPVLHQTVAALWEACTDKLGVKKINPQP